MSLSNKTIFTDLPSSSRQYAKHQVPRGPDVTPWRPSQSDYDDAPTMRRNRPKASASYPTRFGLFARRIKPRRRPETRGELTCDQAPFSRWAKPQRTHIGDVFDGVNETRKSAAPMPETICSPLYRVEASFQKISLLMGRLVWGVRVVPVFKFSL